MKNYLIIGGSSGIGRSLADKLSVSGMQVFATYHTKVPDKAVDGISYFHCNVLDDEPLDVAKLPETLHGLAYCPGNIDLMPFKRIKPQSFREDYELQVLGAVKILQAAEPRLKAAGSASVVLFSTVAVQNGFNFHSLVSASKGAVEGLTRSLSAEWAPAVRVNAIAPSLTDTPLAGKLLNTDEKKNANALRHPLKRIGSPSDIAETAAFLLSDRSSWITGQVLHVDGGISSIR